MYKVTGRRRKATPATTGPSSPTGVDANGDCQDTRQEVLITESKVNPTYTSSRHCTVAKGKWVSRWDGRTWTNPSDVDIDHHVALSEAWGSGARSWTSSERRAYANDTYGPTLERDHRQPEQLQG